MNVERTNPWQQVVHLRDLAPGETFIYPPYIDVYVVTNESTDTLTRVLNLCNGRLTNFLKEKEVTKVETTARWYISK